MREVVGIRLVIAHSFAPIHERNNLNLGQLMGGYEVLERLQRGEEVALAELTEPYDPITRVMLESGGLFPFAKLYREGAVSVPVPGTAARPMTMGEKILASKVVGAEGDVHLKPGDVCLVNVDGGYSHEFTTAQVHHFLSQEYGADYSLPNPAKFAVFEDHLLYATGVERMKPFTDQIQLLRGTCRWTSSVTPEFGTTPRPTACPRASATRSRARSSSIPATSSRPPTATPAWAEATPSPTAWAPPSTRA